MTENMITVALIIGDPGHDDLQLNEGCLTAAAKTIEVHGAATHARWDAGPLDVEAPLVDEDRAEEQYRRQDGNPDRCRG